MQNHNGTNRLIYNYINLFCDQNVDRKENYNFCRPAVRVGPDRDTQSKMNLCCNNIIYHVRYVVSGNT